MAYDTSEKNFLRLLEIAKQNDDEIRSELSQPRVRDTDKQKIDEEILSKREKIFSTLSRDNVLDKFEIVERSVKGNSYRKLFFLIVASLFLSSSYLSNRFRTDLGAVLQQQYTFFADVQNLDSYLYYLILLGYAIGIIFLVLAGVNAVRDTNKLEDARAEVNNQVFERLHFELRQAINQHIRKISYSKTCSVTIANGLEEGYDAAFEVDTPARQYAEALISKMSRGSIGVSGPRGTGKTTLLKSSEGFTSSGLERVFIQVSAPVVYDAREFIMYMYAAICTSVIRKIDPLERYETILSRGGKQWRSNYDPMSFLWYRILLPVAIIIFLLIGVFALEYIGGVLFDGREVRVFNVPINVLEEGMFILSAIVLFLIGISFPVFFLFRFYSLLISGSKKDFRSLSLAYAERRRIRYQQTMSNSRGGKFNVAVFEGGIDKFNSQQEYPMSLPEVTYSYRDFVNRLSEKFQFIIAIDELDKIEDPQQAQSFLNDLKNILALKNCFYLVSVSQNAMSSFELRGLPFRDAFDSTFDEIIHVGYLNHDTASSIVKRRLIGFSEPFIQLAFVLSGGLPRDLIRVTRKIVMETISQGGKVDLVTATLRLTQDDINRKFDAVRQQIQENQWAFLAQGMLSKIDSLANEYSAKEINEIGAWLVRQGKNINGSGGDESYKYALLIYELGMYMLYVATLLEYFVMQRPSNDFRNAAKKPSAGNNNSFSNSKSPIDMLVFARQRMSTNGETALILINEFRSSYSMQPISI